MITGRRTRGVRLRRVLDEWSTDHDVQHYRTDPNATARARSAPPRTPCRTSPDHRPTR